jgi:hypothetical protein
MDISGTSTPTLCLLLEIGFAAAHAERALKTSIPALRVSGPYFYNSRQHRNPLS